MQIDRQQVIETADFLRQSLSKPPVIGLLTGTGFCDILEDIQIEVQLDYSQIPHFPIPTIESHKGKLIFGSVQGKNILIMQGRFHLYEGYSTEQVTFPIRVMQELGIKTLILSNAAGGINLNFCAGQIMIIKDHINLTGKNPLTGPNEEAWGVRFPDMTQVYDPTLITLARTIAKTHGIPIQTGVYVGLLGPSLETPAETRFLKTIGADAVGFSTIMEAIAGVHAKMKILGISLITNINNPDNPKETTLEEVLKTAQKALKPFNQLLYHLIAKIPDR